ncbi:PQQ-binding-like beta-propeller repeat protein [Methanolobus sp. ZRKC2]|uniref:outer membrane protein assembly factor BamB family protein n=1 Tax=Methanolobus sp. ZRKC2 TaxID=3125783 RepID=UPI0032479281
MRLNTDIKKIVAIFLVLAGIVSLTFAAMATPSDYYSGSQWHKFQKNNYNNGVTSEKAPIINPVANGLFWEQNFEYSGMSGFNTAPVVVNDILYIAGADNILRAMDKNTGNVLWETPTSGEGFLIANIAYGDGSIFVPTKDGKIFSIDSLTGAKNWNVSVTSAQLNTPVTYENQNIYFGEYGGINSYYCYDANTGVQIWSRPSNSGGGYYWAGAALIGDYLVYGDENSHLVSVNKIDGSTVDEIDVSTVFGVSTEAIRSSVCYVEESQHLYFSSRGGYCYSLGFNPATGIFETSDTASHYIGWSTSTPTVYNSALYVGTGASMGGTAYTKLFCLDAVTLDEKWNFTANGPVQSSPVISTAYDNGDGEVYIYFTSDTDPGMIYCLDKDGVLQWSWGDSAKTAYMLCGVAISDGRIFYGTDEMYVFGFATDESLHIIDFTSNVTSGMAPLNVQFTDMTKGATSWEWDIDGDGMVDYTIQNPSHQYTTVGKYTVSLSVATADKTDAITVEDYIYVADDWNPWNDPDSDSGEMITFAEVMEAYNSFVSQSGAPGTGEDIDFATVMVMYNAFVSQTSM